MWSLCFNCGWLTSDTLQYHVYRSQTHGFLRAIIAVQIYNIYCNCICYYCIPSWLLSVKAAPFIAQVGIIQLWHDLELFPSCLSFLSAWVRLRVNLSFVHCDCQEVEATFFKPQVVIFDRWLSNVPLRVQISQQISLV